jgi:hypothetical protein
MSSILAQAIENDITASRILGPAERSGIVPSSAPYRYHRQQQTVKTTVSADNR